MQTFREMERARQTHLRDTHPEFFPASGLTKGKYHGHDYACCLPLEYSKENLFAEIRDSIRQYFKEKKIKWHGGLQPSNHLLSSQICCANMLYPFASRPEALKALLQPHFPQIQEMLPMEDSYFVSFEWIGEQNYLHEISWGKRGALCTSADAAVRFKRTDGRIQIVLIEWKYTESYGGVSLPPGKNDKKRIYNKLAHKTDGALYLTGQHERQTDDKTYDALFHEPFYQLMRQQLLAHEMERAQEKGAEIVSNLHIAPAHNLAFHTTSWSPLCPDGESPTAAWARLVRHPDRFQSLYTEKLYTPAIAKAFPDMAGWWQYVSTRYASICAPVAETSP